MAGGGEMMSQKKLHEVNELLPPSYSWATIAMAWWFLCDGGTPPRRRRHRQWQEMVVSDCGLLGSA